jgi:hypothetical protein
MLLLMAEMKESYIYMENSFSTSNAVSEISESMKGISQLEESGTHQSERHQTDPSSRREAVLSP